MLDDPSYISQGTLKVKIMAASIEDSIVAALNHLNVCREKQKIILKKEQEMAVKELLAGRDVMAILPTGFGRYVLQVAGCRLQVETTCLFESKSNKPQYRG